MTTQMRPRPEEFFLALLWLIGTGAWGWFGLIGYFNNVSNLGPPNYSLIGFILGYYLLCMTVFGWRFILNTFRRLWVGAPAWTETLATLTLGTTLVAGFLFSLFSLVMVLTHLFDPHFSNLIFVEGLLAAVGMVLIAIAQFVTALRAFEPFLGWTDPAKKGGLLTPLKKFQLFLHGRNFGPQRNGDQLSGPLLLENDVRTSQVEEKAGGRNGLEKTMVAHGGYHVTTLGFTANGAVIFTVSDGGTVHFQAGGRKGTMFPPELKFWEWSSGRVQTVSMGSPQTFLTKDYKTPASLQDYRFLVPTGGSKFAWVRPNLLQVGNWSDDQTQKLAVDEGLVLRSYNGFLPLAFSPEGSRIAWCTNEGQPRLWTLDTDQVQPLRAYPVPHEDIQTGTAEGAWGLIFSPDGTRIATVGGQGLLLQNVYTGWRWFRPLDAQDEKLTAFAFSNSGFEMAMGILARPPMIRISRSGRRNGVADSLAERSPQDFVPIVRLWDLREERYTDFLVGDTPLRELAYSSDNRLLAGVDEAGILRLWEIAPEGSLSRPPRLVSQLDLGLSGRKIIIAFSPDVQRLVCATDNRVLVWNLARLRQEAHV